MTKTMWKDTWYPGRRALTTADAAEALIETYGGVAERAQQTAENTARALGRLVETLHEKGLLTTDEVQNVLGLRAYEAVEGES